MITVQSVRDSIKHNVQLSREICARIRSSKGRDRYDAWNEKRSHGADTRVLLLTLAYLRKKPYKAAEPHTATSVPVHRMAVYLGVEARELLWWFEVPATAEKREAA